MVLIDLGPANVGLCSRKRTVRTLRTLRRGPSTVVNMRNVLAGSGDTKICLTRHDTKQQQQQQHSVRIPACVQAPNVRHHAVCRVLVAVQRVER